MRPNVAETTVLIFLSHLTIKPEAFCVSYDIRVGNEGTIIFQ